MAHHPLTQYVESILRLKRYRFRQEDLINLLRTGLYIDLSQADIDTLSTSPLSWHQWLTVFSKHLLNPTRWKI